MNTRVVLGLTGIAGAAALLSQIVASDLTSVADAGAKPAAEAARDAGAIDAIDTTGHDLAASVGAVAGAGPDVMVWEIYDGLNQGTEDGVRAFSFGTEPLEWLDFSGGQPDNRHPVISQNMYRLDLDRDVIEQVGQSWLKHGFCALDGNSCGTCNANFNCDYLAVGCSDPYDGFLNGQQSNLGPKYEVNPFTGDFPYPPADPSWSGDVDRRLQVKESDLDPDLYPNAQYFVEAQYIAGDDAAAGNGFNNVSYRRITVNSSGEFTGFLAGTKIAQTALKAWQTINNDVILRAQFVPGDGRFDLAFRTNDLGNGLWSYEYAVFNMNSARACGQFSIEVPDNVTLSDVEFHDVDYHSGEPYDGTDWVATHEDGRLTWSTESAVANANANALRWGTTYNFRFVANAPPRDSQRPTQIWLFEPGTPDFIEIFADAPDGEAVVEPACAYDCGDPADGEVGVTDLLRILADWGQADSPCDADGGGTIDVGDLLGLLGAWGPCP